MRIGSDASIQTCRDEGYMVMDYPVYKFKSDPVNTDCRFTCSMPDYLRHVGEKVICTDIWLNWNDLWEVYSDNKEGMDSMIGGSHPIQVRPDPHDLLELASDIDAYCGLV